MIASFEVLLIVLGIATPVYWLIPCGLERWRTGFVIAVSLVLLFALSPLILVWLFIYIAAVLIFLAGYRRGIAPDRIKALTWIFFLPLPFVDMMPSGTVSSFLNSRLGTMPPGMANFTFIGISYTAIRAFLVVREAMNRGDPRFLSSLNALTFFSAFIAGPIAGSNYYVREKVAGKLTAGDFLTAISRIGWGVALFLIVGRWLSEFDLLAAFGMSQKDHSTLQAWIAMYRSFVVLYVDFSGSTSVAIGAALLFGIRLPENFRAPWLALSVQQFWQRWHLSLVAFITTYLFKPLVRAYGRPVLAIFITFVLVGLWHKFSWNYLLWGIGHGATLSANMIVKKRLDLLQPGKAVTYTLNTAGWLFTMTWVSFLSAMANASGLEAAGLLVQKLCGQ